MDSVNPVILVTAGTAVVGLIAAVSVCMKNSSSPSRSSSPAPKVNTNSKTIAKPSPQKSPVIEAPVVETNTESKKKRKPKKKASTTTEELKEQLSELEDDNVPPIPVPVQVPTKISVVPQKNSGKSKAKSPTPQSTTVPPAGTYAAASAAANPAVANPSQTVSSGAKEGIAKATPASVKPPENEKIDEMAIYRFEAGIDDDNWNVVEDKRKAKSLEKAKTPKTEKSAVVTASEVAGAASQAVDLVTSQVSVDSKKIGIIIGPKGATLKAIKEKTGADIQTPKDKDVKDGNVSVTVTGPAEGVASAVNIINDLCSKGYAALLEGEDFSEGSASVHPTHVMDLIGKGGAIRKAIQDHSGVRITIPTNFSRDQVANIRVGVAGPKGKVTEAKKIIKELIKYKHHPVTHPGLVHQELEIPSSLYNVIIGARGSEIKQIQGNYKVSVHIPNEHSAVQSVLVVGEPKSVEAAVKYIQKILEQATRDRTAAVDTAEVWAEVSAAQEDEDVTEEWMQEFVHPSKRKPAASAASNPAPTAPTGNAGAWSGVMPAEGW